MIKTKAILVIIFIIGITFSCSKKDDKTGPEDYKTFIIGHWNETIYTETTYVDGVKTTSETKSISEDQAEDYTFNKDGTFVLNGSDPLKYNLEDSQLVLHLGKNNDDDQAFDIISLTKKQLFLEVVRDYMINGKPNKVFIDVTYVKVK
ncbi:hypothetical protein SAMN05216436_11463 [bacterium A37T11]|nr:hypothetical protein SAMN05216436_11463 [bacterium A37T11]